VIGYKLKYSGPTIALAGIITIAIFTLKYPPTNYIISAWLIWSALSVSQVLPLAGLGIALSLVSLRLVFISVTIFIASFLSTLSIYGKIWFWFSNSPDASQHFYLTIPILSLCSGLLLVVPKILCKYMVVPASLTSGSMLAITIKLTDPTLHNPLIIKLGLFIGIWIILSFMLIMRSFYQSWFLIPIRILGSWLLASGLLYAGATLMAKYGIITSKKPNTKTLKIEPSSNDDILIPNFTQDIKK